jgi:hypothetical protein
MRQLDLNARQPYAVVADVECNGDRRWVGSAPLDSSVAEIEATSYRIGLFDWGTFFFFSSIDQLPATRNFDQCFLIADITIRAIDGEFFYIYTPSSSDVAILQAYRSTNVSLILRRDVQHPF